METVGPLQEIIDVIKEVGGDAKNLIVKKGLQIHVSPFFIVVAGRGFEPLTFGL